MFNGLGFVDKSIIRLGPNNFLTIMSAWYELISTDFLVLILRPQLPLTWYCATIFQRTIKDVMWYIIAVSGPKCNIGAISLLQPLFRTLHQTHDTLSVNLDHCTILHNLLGPTTVANSLEPNCFIVIWICQSWYSSKLSLWTRLDHLAKWLCKHKILFLLVLLKI